MGGVRGTHGEEYKYIEFLWENLRDLLEDLGVNGRIILKLTLK
jgi:hypothetical protein